MGMRKEHDLLGTLEIDDACYYGIQTQRALTNFNITGVTIAHYPHLIKGMLIVKRAAALANAEIGLLDAAKADAIVKACDHILEKDALKDQFVTDILQGGAGTSVNMNINEVVANLALELAGKKKGEYDYINPMDHVNMGQSTNDAYASGLRIATYSAVTPVIEALEALVLSFKKKGSEYSSAIKMGRTHLQDAVPMTIEMEFFAMADALAKDIKNIKAAQELFLSLNLGGTAIGTELNAGKGYREKAVQHIASFTKNAYYSAANLITGTWDCGDYVSLSGAFKTLASRLSKICNDLRMLNAGPRANIKELNLPERQPGSSIMPAKVNPVIAEVTNQVCFTVIGNDLTVTLAAEAGQLQLNVMEPAISKAIFESATILANAMNTLRTLCIDGIVFNVERCKEYVLSNIGIITYLNPYIGHAEGDIVGKICAETGKNVREVVLERKLLTEKEVDEILSMENLLHPEIKAHIKQKH